MVQENKATLSYTQLLKEDLGIFRLVPEDGVLPAFNAAQFLPTGKPAKSEGGTVVGGEY